MLQVSVNNIKEFLIGTADGDYLVNELPAKVAIDEQPNGLISVLLNGRSYTAIIEKIDRKSKEVTLRVNGQTYVTTVKEPIDQLLSTMGLDLKAMHKAEAIKAPMPGMVLKILVSPGQQVVKGDGLIVLEAMKMENLLKASAPGTVKSIRTVERTAVEKGAILIEME